MEILKGMTTVEVNKHSEFYICIYYYAGALLKFNFFFQFKVSTFSIFGIKLIYVYFS